MLKATVAEKNFGGKTKGERSNLNVDLTPMVDLGFLLITFFMFTASLQEATTMNLVMPKDSTDSTETIW